MKILSFLLLLVCLMFGEDFKNAEELYSKGKYQESYKEFLKFCENNNSKACAKVAFMHRNAQIKPSSKQLALEFYTKACKLFDGKSCYRVGSFYEAQNNLESFKKANEFFGLGCDENDAQSCNKLGEIGLFILKSSNREILSYFSKACKLKLPQACYNLASMHEKTLQDIPKAKIYFEQSCNFGDKQACFKLADLYIKDLVNTQNYANMSDFYETRCFSGENEYCYKLSALYLKGAGVLKSTKRAKDYLKLACNNGDKLSCMELIMVEDMGL